MDGPDGNAHYWADTRLEREHFPTRARGGQVLMVWGAISKKSKSELVFVDANLNALAYTTMLTNYLIPFIENRLGGEDDEAVF